MEEPLEELAYRCRACGAAIEVRVRFRGKVVWTLEADNPDFGNNEPELRGIYGDPSLTCSADVLHNTGFKLLEGEVVPIDS